LAETRNELTFLTECKTSDSVPKGLTLEAPYRSLRPAKIALRASKTLLIDRIQSCLFQKASLNKEINEIDSFFRISVDQSDYLHVLSTVGSSFKHKFLKQEGIQTRKLSALKGLDQTTRSPKATRGPQKLVRAKVLIESEMSVLKERLNFAVTN
jgi:hypothetical protein